MVTRSLTKELKLSSGKKTAFSTKGAGSTVGQHRRMQIDPLLSPCTELKSKWIKDLYIQPDTLKHERENAGKS